MLPAAGETEESRQSYLRWVMNQRCHYPHAIIHFWEHTVLSLDLVSKDQ